MGTTLEPARFPIFLGFIISLLRYDATSNGRVSVPGRFSTGVVFPPICQAVTDADRELPITLVKQKLDIHRGADLPLFISIRLKFLALIEKG